MTERGPTPRLSNELNKTRSWNFDHSANELLFRAAIPNLGYVHPRGYMRNLKWFKYYAILSNIYFDLKNSQGVRKFLFLCLGVREHKKVGNRWFRAKKLHLQSLNKNQTRNFGKWIDRFFFHRLLSRKKNNPLQGRVLQYIFLSQWH